MRSKTTRGEGLVPRWGGGGARQNPPCQLVVPSHNSGLSYLGVQAPGNPSNRHWHENDVTRVRLCLGIPQISRVVIGTKMRLNGFRVRQRPPFVIPAKAGIPRGGERGM